MLSTQHVNTHPVRPQGVLPQGGNLPPETEGFDFMSYLLGLQVGGLPEVSTENGPSAKPQTVEGNVDPLLSLFNKDRNNSWNPMFPGAIPGVAGSQGAMSSGTAKAESETSGQPDFRSQESLAGLPLPSASKPAQVPTDSQTEKVQSPPSTESFSAIPGLAIKGGSTREEKAESSQVQMSQPGQMVNGTANAVPHAAKPESAPEVMGNAATLATSAASAKAEALETAKSDRKRSSADDLSSVGLSGNQPLNGAGLPFGPEALLAAKKPGGETSVPELFSKVESMVHHGGGKMSVTLTPAHLGQVEIQVTTKGKRVEIEMKSQSEAAKSVIESKLADLKQSLQSHDLHLSKVEVQVSREVSRPFTGNSFTALANGNQSFQGQQAFSNQAHAGRQFKSANRMSEQDQVAPVGVARVGSTHAGRTVSANGRVDIRI